jgi:hypothetical protein
MDLSQIAKQIVLRNAKLTGSGMRAGMQTAGCYMCPQGGLRLAGKREKMPKMEKPKQKRAPSAWITFVKNLREQNPQLSYKEALQEASKIYQKGCKKTQVRKCQKFDVNPQTKKRKCKTFACYDKKKALKKKV